MTTDISPHEAPLWKRLWLLVSSIWALVALLNAATIWFAGDAFERAGVWVPLASAVLVPALLYAVLRGWAWWRGRGTGTGSGAG